MIAHRLAALAFALGLAATLPAAAQDNPPAPPAAEPDAPPPLPPQPAPEEIKYFVGENGQAVGPLTIAEVKARIEAGTLTKTTLVWKKGMAEWSAADKLAELAALFVERPAPPPFDCTKFVLGTWRREVAIDGQPVTVITRFEPNGQYSGVQTALGMPGLSFYGTWTATAVGEKACSFALNAKHPYPGPVTIVYEVVSDTVITDKSDGSHAIRIE